MNVNYFFLLNIFISFLSATDYSVATSYGNDCYAENAGVTEWTEGECD